MTQDGHRFNIPMHGCLDDLPDAPNFSLESLNALDDSTHPSEAAKTDHIDHTHDIAYDALPPKDVYYDTIPSTQENYDVVPSPEKHRDATPRKRKPWPLLLAAAALALMVLALPGRESTEQGDVSQTMQTGWSSWSDTLPASVSERNYQIEERTLYRSRQQETTTSTSSSLTGWELYDTLSGNGSYGPWSDWSQTDISSTGTRQAESQIRYRYRDWETTSSSASQMSGWILYDLSTTYGDWGSWSDWYTSADFTESDSLQVQEKLQYRSRPILSSTQHSNWGDWSNWQDSAISANDLTDVETRTVYEYYYYPCPNCGNHWHGYGFPCYTWGGGCGNATIPDNYISVWGTTPQSQMDFQDWYGTGHSYAYYNGQRVFRNIYADHSKTQYRYRTRTANQVPEFSSWSGWSDTRLTASDTQQVETRVVCRYRERPKVETYYFYRWKPWSDWSTDAVSSSETRQVESTTFYRYRDRVTETTYCFRRWTDWTEYGEAPVSASDTIQVQAKTQYRYQPKNGG